MTVKAVVVTAAKQDVKMAAKRNVQQTVLEAVVLAVPLHVQRLVPIAATVLAPLTVQEIVRRVAFMDAPTTAATVVIPQDVQVDVILDAVMVVVLLALEVYGKRVWQI